MDLKEIYRYTGLLYGANLVSSFITFLVLILITRAISKEGMGLYGLYQAYLLMCVYVSGLGVSSTIVRFVAQRRVPIAQIHTLIGRIWLAMAAVFLTAGGVLIAYGKEILGLAILTLPAYHLFEFSLSYARGHLWRNAEWLILLGSSLATSVMIVVLLQWFPDHRGPIYGQVFGAYLTAFSVAAAFFYFTRGKNLRFAPIEGEWIKEFSYIALPVFIASSLYALNDVTDRMIIEKYLGLEAVAEFVLALGLFNILDRPAGLLAKVLLSHFSGNHATVTDPQLHAASVRRIIKLNLLVLPTFSLALITVIPLALPLVLNKDYSNAFDILAIVSVLMVMKSFELVHSMLLIARSHPSANIYSQLTAFAVYLPVALGLVQVFGVFGVAVAVAVRWAVFAAWQFRQLHRLRIATVPDKYLLCGLTAYLLALALYHKAPWAMVGVYLTAGVAMQLWSLREFRTYSNIARLRQLWGK